MIKHLILFPLLVYFISPYGLGLTLVGIGIAEYCLSTR